MKKILIINNNLKIGGIQKSLVNLISSLYDHDEFNSNYEINIGLFYKNGEYLKEIPKNVKIIDLPKRLQILGMSQEEARGKSFFWKIFRGIYAVIARLLGKRIAFLLLFLGLHKMIYDIAISYMHNTNDASIYGGCNEYVINKIIADKKIAFIHCDYKNFGGNSKYNVSINNKFDNIVFVSNSCKQQYLTMYPYVQEKARIVYNCHNYGDINNKSKENTINYRKDVSNIISVCRLTGEKGIYRGIPLMKIIKEKGYNFQWHIIGDGQDKEKIINKINELGLSGDILLYGNQDNPYKYMKNADFLFIPSYHEASPMVINEAKFLSLPILSTNTISAHEMISENEGLICENEDQSILLSLIKMLELKLYKDMKLNLEKEFYYNTISTSQILELLF